MGIDYQPTHEKRMELQRLFNEAFGVGDLTPYTGQEWTINVHASPGLDTGDGKQYAGILEIKLITSLTPEQIDQFHQVLNS